MSPAALTAADPIRAVLARRFPRTPPTAFEIAADGLVWLRQAPEADDLLFKVVVGPHTATLQRLDPESHDPWPGAQPEQVPIPEPVPEPVATATPSLLSLAERLQQATTSAHGQLQAVATSGPDEIARLQAIAAAFDPPTARDHLSNLVAQSLAAYLNYENVLSEALRTMEAVQTAQVVTAQAVATLRTSDSLAAVGEIHQHEARAREQRLGLVELTGAVREAMLYREALCSCAARLACASVQAAAHLRVSEVTARLLTLKQAVQALRAEALGLPPTLLAATQHFARLTGRALPMPRLYWPEPKNLFAPPVIAPE